MRTVRARKDISGINCSGEEHFCKVIVPPRSAWEWPLPSACHMCVLTMDRCRYQIDGNFCVVGHHKYTHGPSQLVTVTVPSNCIYSHLSLDMNVGRYKYLPNIFRDYFVGHDDRAWDSSSPPKTPIPYITRSRNANVGERTNEHDHK